MTLGHINSDTLQTFKAIHKEAHEMLKRHHSGMYIEDGEFALTLEWIKTVCGDSIEEWENGIWYWQVKWSHEYATFCITHNPSGETFYSDDMISVFHNGKVVGNRFDTPELLTK